MRVAWGAGLLFAGLVAIVLVDGIGPAAMFVSWALCAAGLLLLRRQPAHRRAADIGLVALVVAILSGAILAGVTIGARGGVLARTPTLDPAFAFAAIGFVAAWVGTAGFLVVVERAARARLALAGSALLLLGALLFVGMQLDRLALGNGAILTLTLGSGTLLLLVSLGRFVWRPLTPAAA